MFHKTPQKNRSTYKIRYYSAETDSEQTFILRPGENGVTELDIQLLHRMDDREIENNIKNHHPRKTTSQKAQIEAWRESYIEDFTGRHGYAPHSADITAAMEEQFPTNWCLSIDALVDGADDEDAIGDSSSILASVATLPFEEEPDHISRLHEIVADMPESWQDIYFNVIIGSMSNSSYARLHGKTEGAVRKTVGKIQKRIAEDDYLKNIFHRGTK